MKRLHAIRMITVRTIVAGCLWLTIPFAAALVGSTDSQADSALSAGCFSTFSVGNNDVVCISDHGNVAHWMSYGSGSHFESEGYTVCDLTSPGTYYLDLHNVIEFGWGVPTITQPHGPNTLPLTIRRDTTDEVWRLTQTYTRNTKQVELQVTMKLSNLTNMPRTVRLMRRADLRINGDNHAQSVQYDRTVDSIWVRAVSGVAGITLQGVSAQYSTHLKAGDLNPGTDCDPGNDAVPGSGFDAFTWVSFQPMIVKPGRSIGRTVLYRRI